METFLLEVVQKLKITHFVIVTASQILS